MLPLALESADPILPASAPVLAIMVFLAIGPGLVDFPNCAMSYYYPRVSNLVDFLATVDVVLFECPKPPSGFVTPAS